MTDRTVLRAQLWEITRGVCEWPGCGHSADHMAHIEPRGMGGRPSVDRLSNVAALCRTHHDILDGRTVDRTDRAVSDLVDGATRAVGEEGADTVAELYWLRRTAGAIRLMRDLLAIYVRITRGEYLDDEDDA